MAEQPVRLTLYSRAYCGLCQDMLGALEALHAELYFDLEVLDVDSDPALERRWGDDVPVLMHAERELARHRLEPDLVRAYLSEIR